MNARGWRPERSQGIWRHGAPCLRPFVAAAPWLTLLVLLVLFGFVGDAMVTARGIAVELPEASGLDGEVTGPVALMLETSRGALVFFDDARYFLDDDESSSVLAGHLREAIARADHPTLLVLADRLVPGGDLMKFASLARQNGVRKVLFAEKQTETEE